MKLRTHVGRPMDWSLRSNRLIAGLAVVAAAAAVIVWLNSGELAVLWAPVHVFLYWALVREIDPDHDGTALMAAVAAGVWVLVGLDFAGALPIAAMLVAARLVVHTTGRRPLITDLVPIGIFAAAVSFTTTGFIAGFGLAVAIYVDDRMAPEHNPAAALTAALAALGASGVATLTSAFPQELPGIRPLLVVGIGLLALIAVVREPALPTSQCDSRLKTFLEQRRVHAGRSLVAVLMFVAAVMAGPDALEMGPLAITLTLVLISDEIEKARRR